jgi:uncharacterized protein (DUF1810 family)
MTSLQADGHDPYDLARFETAQAGNFSEAWRELQEGRKLTHWMWYVFPQIDGLGTSVMAKRYAIKSVIEAQAYLAHPVLGVRLVQCAEALLAVSGKTAHEIMGSPDDMKLQSSMTLFARVAAEAGRVTEAGIFRQVLKNYYDGAEDARTVAILERT